MFVFFKEMENQCLPFNNSTAKLHHIQISLRCTRDGSLCGAEGGTAIGIRFAIRTASDADDSNNEDKFNVTGILADTVTFPLSTARFVGSKPTRWMKAICHTKQYKHFPLSLAKNLIGCGRELSRVPAQGIRSRENERLGGSSYRRLNSGAIEISRNTQQIGHGG
jgi:hypothetical protein